MTVISLDEHRDIPTTPLPTGSGPKVYVLQQGEYDEQKVVGVYASLGAAIAATHVWPEDFHLETFGGQNWWANDGDHDKFFVITEYEVK